MEDESNNQILPTDSVSNEGSVGTPRLILKNKSAKNTGKHSVSRNEMNLVTAIMVGVIITFFITFLTMSQDNSADRTQALNEKSRSYQDLRKSYEDQTREIYEMKLELQQIKNDLTNQINKKLDK